MTAKYFNFVDGQRLPGARVKEFLMNQAVIQCENQTEITGSGIENLGARVAINLEDGQLWTYTPDIEAWAPAQNTLDLDLLDSRYYTKVAANGIFISETTADAKYLTEVTARGIFLTQTDGDTKYYTKLQADGLFLSQTTADGRYYTKLQADGLFLTETSADGRYYTKLQADGLYLGKTEAGTTYTTKVEAGNLYIAKTTNAGQFVTSISGDVITTGTINADLIKSGELVGRTIRTVPAGNTSKRIIINTQGEIVFFQSGSSTESGRIEGTPNGLSLTPTSQLSFEPGGSQVAYVSSSGMGFNGSDKRWIGSLVATGGLQAGNGNVVLSSNGNISAASISGSSLSTNGGLTVTAGGASITGGISATSLIDGNANIRTGGRFRQDSTWDGFTGSTQAVHRRISDGFFGPSGSDIRLKENVEDLDKGLDFVNNLRPVKYTYKSETESPIINYGLIAQEVQPLVEENSNVVSGEETETNFLSIEYIQFVSPLIKAIQELSAKNDALEARIAALEGGAQ
jgi:hypothetical protein